MYLTLCLGNVFAQFRTLVICWMNLYDIMCLKNSSFKMCFIRKYDRFPLLPIRKGCPAPLQTECVLLGFESQVQKPWLGLDFHYISNIIKEAILMKSVTINCYPLWVAKIRHSIGHPGNQCNFKSWGGIRIKTSTDALPGLWAGWLVSGKYTALTGASGDLFHWRLSVPFQALSKYTSGFFGSFMSLLLPPWPCYHLELDRMYTGHLTTQASKISEIKEKAVPLCFYLKGSILIK